MAKENKMSGSMKLWKFKGRVEWFDKVVDRNYKAETYAVTEQHAIRNLTARYKKDNNYAMNARIKLIGKVKHE